MSSNIACQMLCGGTGVAWSGGMGMVARAASVGKSGSRLRGNDEFVGASKKTGATGAPALFALYAGLSA
jgi:hypothetical protein